MSLKNSDQRSLSYPDQPADQVMEANINMHKDINPNKINCVFGAYNDNFGKLYKFDCVKFAEQSLHENLQYTHEYVPSAGTDEFVKLSTNLYFGNDQTTNKSIDIIKPTTCTHYKGVQTIGGTGSLSLAGKFMDTIFEIKEKIIWVPDPTWENHVYIFQEARFEVKRYKYLTESHEFDFDFLCDMIRLIPDNHTILLHGCAHNPTGYDLTLEQLKKVTDICKSKNLFIVVDLAYMGFASGNIDTDRNILKILNDDFYPSVICTSYSKNFGLYSDRVGMLFVSADNEENTMRSYNILKGIIRRTYSCPPTSGSKIISHIISIPSLKHKWLDELKQINDRYTELRQHLKTALESKLNEDFSDIIQQKGMFWYAKKHLTNQQIEYIISKHVHIVKNGRISISSLNDSNIDMFINVFIEAKTNN